MKESAIKRRVSDESPMTKEFFLQRIKRRRIEHEAEVNLLVCRYKSQINAETLQDAKINPEMFWNNLQRICKQWMGIHAPIGDCQGKRCTYKVLRERLNDPLTIATIGDNVDFFQANSTNALKPSVKYWLDWACLCGSRSIVDYILKTYEYTIADLENATEYAISSGNKDLTLGVAALSRTLGKENPGLIHIYSFGGLSLAEQVDEIFSRGYQTVRFNLR